MVLGYYQGKRLGTGRGLRSATCFAAPVGGFVASVPTGVLCPAEVGDAKQRLGVGKPTMGVKISALGFAILMARSGSPRECTSWAN